MRHKLCWLPLILGAGYWGYHWASRQVTPVASLRQRRLDTQYAATPTLFIPGWGGNAWTYNGLLRWLARAGFGHKVLTVRVNREGDLRFAGHWDQAADNPLIQVLFDRPFTADYQPQIRWITAILRHLKSHDHVRTYNLVAHSWGGSAAVSSLLLNGAGEDVPRLNRLILLGAPIDEHDAAHPVDATFQRLRATPVDWDKLGAGVIHNVYGLLPGRLTDGSVPVTQVTALRSLVAGSALQYQEHPIPGVGHGRLHAAPQMWRLIARLLWAS